MEAVEIRGNKSTSDLVREALWYALHTLLSVIILAAIIAGFWLAGTDQEAPRPKIICTALAFFVPMIFGYIAGKMQKGGVAGYIWISGLLWFLVVCVHVLDLPTGPGLCEHCTLIERLYRTFFFIDGNSGLMGGDGILVGTWIPLAMIGYAIGARLAGGFNNE